MDDLTHDGLESPAKLADMYASMMENVAVTMSLHCGKDECAVLHLTSGIHTAWKVLGKRDAKKMILNIINICEAPYE